MSELLLIFIGAFILSAAVAAALWLIGVGVFALAMRLMRRTEGEKR